MKKILSLLVCSFLSLAISGCGTAGFGGGSGSDEVQYAALGASETTGVGASSPSHRYVELIKDGIENAGHSTNMMNYGIPDIEIGGIRDVELKLLDQGHTPNLVTIFAGSNDIISGATPSHFEDDLAAILGHLNEKAGVRIFIADLPDLTQFPRFRDSPDKDVSAARVREFNDVVHRQAAAFGAHVVSLSGETFEDSLFSSDGLHPNDDGNKRIADLFIQEILPTL